MQVQKFIGLRFWLLLVSCGPLLGCVGIPSGHEVGVHGGMFTQGVHAAYQGWNRAGFELGFDQNSQGISNDSTSFSILYGDMRYYLSTVFLVKLGVAHARSETTELGYWNNATSSRLRASTLGAHASFGNLWHLKNGMAIGCDYFTGYQPVSILSQDLQTKGGRLSAAARRRIEENILQSSIGLLTFYLGYDF